MDDNKKNAPEEGQLSFLNRYSFFTFISVSIFLSLVLVSVSMAMYNSSGAAQLDLSRPGYVSVRSQADANDKSLKTFSGSGNLTQEDIDYFQEIYTKQTEKVTFIEAFSGDPLSPASLGVEPLTK